MAQDEVPIKGFTAYNLLTLLYMDHEIEIGGKKYSNFTEYFKKVILLHRDVEITPFEPAVKEHLNNSNIKLTCPIKLTRKVNSVVPMPPSNVPFMPKSGKTAESQSLYIISKYQWVFDSELQNSGIPYSDCFKVYFRTMCNSTPDSCKVALKLYVNFNKSTMMKSVIESKINEESVLVLKRQFVEVRKYLASLSKGKKKGSKSEVSQAISESEKAKEDDAKVIQRLRSKVRNYQILVVLLLIMLGLSLMAWAM
jgi:hypothetical protein